MKSEDKHRQLKPLDRKPLREYKLGGGSPLPLVSGTKAASMATPTAESAAEDNRRAVKPPPELKYAPPIAGAATHTAFPRILLTPKAKLLFSSSTRSAITAELAAPWMEASREHKATKATS